MAGNFVASPFLLIIPICMWYFCHRWPFNGRCSI